jgi:hypothetical protein
MNFAEQTQLPRRGDLSGTSETALPNEAKFAGAVDHMERTNPIPRSAVPAKSRMAARRIPPNEANGRGNDSAEQSQFAAEHEFCRPRRGDLSGTCETALPNEAKSAGAVDDIERMNPIPNSAVPARAR